MPVTLSSVSITVVVALLLSVLLMTEFVRDSVLDGRAGGVLSWQWSVAGLEKLILVMLRDMIRSELISSLTMLLLTMLRLMVSGTGAMSVSVALESVVDVVVVGVRRPSR